MKNYSGAEKRDIITIIININILIINIINHYIKCNVM